MKIKRYNDFIFEDLLDQDAMAGNTGGIKYAINKWLLKGILPVAIFTKLVTMYGEKKSELLIRDVISTYQNADSLFNIEVKYARNIAIQKASKFTDSTEIFNRIKSIPVKIGTVLENDDADAQFVSDTKGTVCIIINKETAHLLDSARLKNVLTHEFFHYVDYLVGQWSKVNEETINLVINKGFANSPESARAKLIYILFGIEQEDRFRHSNPEIFDMLDEYTKDICDNADYYTSHSEVYARFQNLRKYMYENGIISNINSYITKEDLLDLLNSDLWQLFKSNSTDIIPLLIFMNFDVDQINKIAVIDKPTMSNKA